MELAVEKVDDVAIVGMPATELDAANTPEFKRDMAPVLDAHSKVVIDLSKLRFIDSSGLGAFLSCLRKLHEKQGELKLCCLPKQVRAVFDLVRMHHILGIHDTREEAVRAFN
jgi:anti-sigma B factor antagonist